MCASFSNGTTVRTCEGTTTIHARAGESTEPTASRLLQLRSNCGIALHCVHHPHNGGARFANTVGIPVPLKPPPINVSHLLLTNFLPVGRSFDSFRKDSLQSENDWTNTPIQSSGSGVCMPYPQHWPLPQASSRTCLQVYRQRPWSVGATIVTCRRVGVWGLLRKGHHGG